MINYAPVLPPQCILRSARTEDKWILQRFVLDLVRTEALMFDVRVVSYRLLKTSTAGALTIALGLLLLDSSLGPLQIVAGLACVYLFILTLLSAGLLLLYLLMIPLEPLLNWPLYQVIECQQQPIACVALLRYGNYSILYHLVVATAWRRRSLGSYLVHECLQQTEHPIYLVCKPALQEFYMRLGFVPTGWQDVPKAVRPHFHDFEIDRRLAGIAWKVMCYEPLP